MVFQATAAASMPGNLLLHFILFSAAYLGLDRRDNSLSREIQMFLSPVTSTNSSRGIPRCFLSQPRDTISPACPWSAPGSPPGRACPKLLPRETSRRHPDPPLLAPLNAEEQRLYSELSKFLTLSLRLSQPPCKGSLFWPLEYSQTFHIAI